MAKIAVENSLTNVKQALHEKGHEVVPLAENMEACDCCVISGKDQNMMGIADRATRASVINANGMTAEQVAERVEQSLQQARA